MGFSDPARRFAASGMTRRPAAVVPAPGPDCCRRLWPARFGRCANETFGPTISPLAACDYFNRRRSPVGHEKKTGVPLKTADEQDALTGWRKVTQFRPGERKAAKTSFNRRVRIRPVEIEELD